ncbi:Fatty-acid-CoA ligase FadD6 [Boothiomyces sp. JEL0838]|nr:Fatty-acid-CoA ligase FadD6 [Boothiomyces sp. JEL0838]
MSEILLQYSLLGYILIANYEILLSLKLYLTLCFGFAALAIAEPEKHQWKYLTVIAGGLGWFVNGILNGFIYSLLSPTALWGMGIVSAITWQFVYDIKGDDTNRKIPFSVRLGSMVALFISCWVQLDFNNGEFTLFFNGFMHFLWKVAAKSLLILIGLQLAAPILLYQGIPDPFNIWTEINFGLRILPQYLMVRLYPIYSKVYRPSGAFIVNTWMNTVKKYHSDEAITVPSGEISLTFDQVNKKINQMASILLKHGVGPKDSVALILENSPDFFITWFAVLKIGGTAAFINTNLKENALAHVLKEASAKVIVMHESLVGNIMTIEHSEFDILFFDGTEKLAFGTNIDISTGSEKEPDPKLRSDISISDPAAYIYTSGTTGLPKAAIISHSRLYVAMKLSSALQGVVHEDRIYICLPLYHSAGGMLGLGMMVHNGATVILSKKFSASRFIAECRATRATGAQYIGELCRYLMNTPEKFSDKDHSLKFMIGNGLRPEIWLAFKQRFGIPKIIEFYMATEGNVQLFNVQDNDNFGIGSMGRFGLITGVLSTRTLIKIDQITGEPVRGPDGFCQVCKDGEPGELIGQIKNNDPQAAYVGYKGESSKTTKKILTNVFRKGDAYFETGDIAKRDYWGYVYFVDRIGDTFRWKGENVSTTEVAKAFTPIAEIEETNVYGVAVPGFDGRAGMAALIVKENFDIDQLAPVLTKSLPSYAIPVFIRILPEMHSTGTMKQVKTQFRNEGCDPNIVKDPIYRFEGGKYVPFTIEDYQNVSTLKI